MKVVWGILFKDGFEDSARSIKHLCKKLTYTDRTPQLISKINVENNNIEHYDVVGVEKGRILVKDESGKTMALDLVKGTFTNVEVKQTVQLTLF